MKFRDVQHFYLGCECVLPDGSTFTLQPSNLPSNWKTAETNHKPLLLSLEDMTEDEIKEYQSLHDGGSLLGMAKRIHFLTSKGFDAFYLIDSGEAIRKTV